MRPTIAAQRFPPAFSPMASKMSCRRSTCPFVCSRCSSNPERSSCDSASFASLGNALTRRFSASYKSLSSSKYNSLSDNFAIEILQRDWAGSNFDFTWIEIQQSIQASSENHTWLAADFEKIAKTDWKTNREPTCQDFSEKGLRFIREPISRISRSHKNRELAACREERNQLRDKIVDGALSSSE